MMAVIQWKMLQELDNLRQQRENLFEEMQQSYHLQMLTVSNEQEPLPTIELQERETDLILRADLPGLESKDIKVCACQDGLSISGKRPQHQNNFPAEKLLMTEVSYGQFERTINLPIPIRRELVSAELVHGVLTVIMPKISSSVQPEKKFAFCTDIKSFSNLNFVR